MRIVKKISALVMAVSLLMSLGIGALAADYTAGDYHELEYAFSGAENEAGDTEVNVTLTNDIEFNGIISTQEGYTYTIVSDEGYGLSDASFYGSGSGSTVTIGTVRDNVDVAGGIIAQGDVDVTINGDVANSDNYESGVSAQYGASITVNGDVTATGENSYGVKALDGSVAVTGDVSGGGYGVYALWGDVTVDGNVTAADADGVGVYANASDVTVGGDVHGADAPKDPEHFSYDGSAGIGVVAYGSQVSIDGDVYGGSGNPNNVGDDDSDYSDGDCAVYAYDSQVTVGGSVYGGDSYGPYGYGGNAVTAYDSTIEIGGDAVGGSVTDDGPSSRDSIGGDGVRMTADSTVTVGGDAIGGSSSAENSHGGAGVAIENKYDYYNDGGSVTVGGSVVGGEGTVVDRYDIDIVSHDAQDTAITVGAYDTVGSSYGVEEEYVETVRGNIVVTGLDVVVDTFWSEVLKDIEAAEKGDEITVDAAHRTYVTAEVLKAVVEHEVTLIIRWDGGEDITLDKDFPIDELEENRTEYKLADVAELAKD